MNKTIIININGTVFHIEEDAYEVLKAYMTDVKRHFMDSADSLEITTDIENRIAEMFTNILAQDNKQVIVEQDVRSVITQMGTVEDFESATEAPQPDNGNNFYQGTENRRLFRDNEDHLIGGVCAGIANYFDIQKVWVRLAFAIAFVFFGTGLAIYIILWVVIPKAVTRADRMAMKGERLDLQGFKRNFEDEINHVRGTVTALGNDAKPFVYKTRDFMGDFFNHLRIFLNGAGQLLLKLAGLIIMLVCIGFIIALIVTVFTFFAYGRDNIYHLFPFSIVNRQYSVPFILGSFLVLALPLLGIIMLTANIVFKRVTINRSAGFTLLIVWIAAVCVVIYYSIKVVAEFRSEGSISQTINVKPNANNTYYLKLNTVRYLSSEDSTRLDIKHGFAGKTIVDNDDDDFSDNGSPDNMRINIEHSDIPQPLLIETISARGRDYANALMNARNTSYQFIQTDSVLAFDRRIKLLASKTWRGQEIQLTLKVPLNTKLIIDRKLNRYQEDIDLDDCWRLNKLNEEASPAFIMTSDGLQCKVDTVVTAKTDPIPNKP